MKQGQGTLLTGSTQNNKKLKRILNLQYPWMSYQKIIAFLGSNTNDNGLKKNKNLGIPKFPKLEKMNKSHSPT